MLLGEVDLTSLGDLGCAAQEKGTYLEDPDHTSLSHLLDRAVGHQHSIAGKELCGGRDVVLLCIWNSDICARVN